MPFIKLYLVPLQPYFEPNVNYDLYMYIFVFSAMESTTAATTGRCWWNFAGSFESRSEAGWRQPYSEGASKSRSTRPFTATTRGKYFSINFCIYAPKFKSWSNGFKTKRLANKNARLKDQEVYQNQISNDFHQRIVENRHKILPKKFISRMIGISA